MRGLRPLRLPARHPNFSMPPEADGAQAARLLRLPARHPSAVTVVGGRSLETLCTDRPVQTLPSDLQSRC